MKKVILLPVTGQCTCQPGAAESAAPGCSSTLAVLHWQATALPVYRYSETGDASAHSSELSSFAVFPIQNQTDV